jgi:dTMP kinase
LQERLAQRGYSVVVTREPGGTVLGEQIRHWILEGEHEALSSDVEALLMFAARGYHLDNVIRPALADGSWVICDRFTDATYAYQGGGRATSLALLDALKSAIHGNFGPDLTLLLDAPVEVGLDRISGRSQDHFEREDRGFFERVRARYLDIAREDSRRVKVIDATQSLDAVQACATAELEAFVERFESGRTGETGHA